MCLTHPHLTHSRNPEPSYAPPPTQVQYASHTHISRLVRLDSCGVARLGQDFVFADVRPLVARPLTIAVYLTKDKE